MEEQKKQTIPLTEYEEKEYRDGIALAEMRASQGFQVLKARLEVLAFHSWADPRDTDKDKWVWREVLSWAAANNARELLEGIDLAVSRADFLGKVKSGEIARGGMKV